MIYYNKKKSQSLQISKSSCSSEYTTISLPDGWHIPYQYYRLSPYARWLYLQYIPVQRAYNPQELEVAAFDIDTQKIGNPLAVIKKEEHIAALGETSCVITTPNYELYLVAGTQRCLLDQEDNIHKVRCGDYALTLDRKFPRVLYLTAQQKYLTYQDINNTKEVISLPNPYNKEYKWACDVLEGTETTLYAVISLGEETLYIKYDLITKEVHILKLCGKLSGTGLRLHSNQIISQIRQLTDPYCRDSEGIRTFAYSLASQAKATTPWLSPETWADAIISSSNAQWHEISTHDAVYVWKLIGVGDQTSTCYKRYLLRKFSQLYEHAKEKHAQCHLTSDQWDCYLELFGDQDSQDLLFFHNLFKWRFVKMYRPTK